MADERNGDWMATATGGQFWPMDPHADDVRLDDIANSLACTCRFNGHMKDCTFYSVAQHAVLVSLHVGVDLVVQQQAMLHDSGEACGFGDIIRPVKGALWIVGGRHTVGYAERKAMEVVLEHFSIPFPRRDESHFIGIADACALLTERRDLMLDQDLEWSTTGEPWPEVIVPLMPREAKKLFLARAKELGIKD